MSREHPGLEDLVSSLPNEIGRRVRAARQRLELTQEELAERVDMEAATVRAVEAGRRGLSVESLVRLAEALHVSPGALLEDPRRDDGVCADEAEAVHILRRLDEPWRSFVVRTLREIQGLSLSYAEPRSHSTSSGQAHSTGSGQAELPVRSEVFNVTVRPSRLCMLRDTRKQFSADVAVTGGAERTVSWEVGGNTSPKTHISQDGTLYVAPGEKAESLIVRATSTVDREKRGTARVDL